MYYLLCPIFGQFLTSPNTRACHQTNSSEGGFVQTNSSEGGFVRKVPSTFFYFFFIIFLSSYFFLSSPLFPFFPLSFSWWSFFLHMRDVVLLISMNSYLVELVPSTFTQAFIYTYFLCIGPVNALEILSMCVDSHEHSLLEPATSI